jgi:hypothetical protein
MFYLFLVAFIHIPAEPGAGSTKGSLRFEWLRKVKNALGWPNGTRVP